MATLKLIEDYKTFVSDLVASIKPNEESGSKAHLYPLFARARARAIGLL